MWKNLLRISTTIAVLNVMPAIVRSQACSCGGAPLLSSLESPATDAGVWRLGVTYEYNAISDLYSGGQKLDSDFSSRDVHSGNFEISYGISSRISVSALVTFLQLEGRSQTTFGLSDFARTRGVGDGIVLVKFNAIPFTVIGRKQISIGGGVKIPIGASDLKNGGILLSPDMQLGTGSWDLILWANVQKGFFQKFPITIFSTVSMRISGKNDRFGPNRGDYKSGNEIVATLGVNFDHLSKVDYNIALRYRSINANEFMDNNLPNSGGKWLNLVPGLSWNITDRIAMRGDTEFPLYRMIEGTQLTTSYTLSGTIFYSLTASKDKSRLEY